MTRASWSASVTFSDRCEDVVPRQHQSKIYLYVYGNHCGSFQPASYLGLGLEGTLITRPLFEISIKQ